MQLSRNFQLSEFPCSDRATPGEIAQLRHLVGTVLQPTRDRWGPIRPTSWRWWSDGCVPRVGDHSAGAVDFVPLRATTAQVARWMGENLHGRFGKVLDEHDHIHVTPPGVGEGKVYTLARNGEWVELELEYGSGGGTRHAGGGWGLALILVAALALSSGPRRK